MARQVPRSLKTWFIVHFAADYIFAIPLILYPKWFLNLFGWTVVDPFASRLVGAALIGIGGISLLKHNDNLEIFRSLLDLKILWSGAALIGVLITMLQGGPLFGWVIFGIFAFFFSIWVYYRLLLQS